MAQAESDDVEDDRRIDPPGRPELPARGAPPRAEQQAPAAPGGERGGELEEQPEGDRHAEEQREPGALDVRERDEQSLAAERRGADQQRGPENRGQQEPAREAQPGSVQHAGGDVGGQPRAGQEARGDDDLRPLAVEPARGALHCGRGDQPGERPVPERAAAKQAPGREEEHVADEDPEQTGEGGDRIGERAARHQQAGADAGKILAAQRGDREEEGEEDRGGAPGARRREATRVERRGRDARRTGLRPAGCRAGIDPRQEGGDRRGDLGRPGQEEEVVPVEPRQLALRHEAGMLGGGGERHETVVGAVDDERRPGPPLQETAQRALVAVGEVAREAGVEQTAVDCSEMGHEVLQAADEDLLHAVDRVVEVVVAEQLELLHADRREQGERAHPLRGEAGQVDRHPAALAHRDEIHPLDPQPLEPGERVAGVGEDRGVRQGARRGAEARQIGDQDAPVAGQRGGERGEVGAAAGAAVQEEQRHVRRPVIAELAPGEADRLGWRGASVLRERGKLDGLHPRGQRRRGAQRAHRRRGHEEAEIERQPGMAADEGASRLAHWRPSRAIRTARRVQPTHGPLVASSREPGPCRIRAIVAVRASVRRVIGVGWGSCRRTAGGEGAPSLSSASRGVKPASCLREVSALRDHRLQGEGCRTERASQEASGSGWCRYDQW